MLRLLLLAAFCAPLLAQKPFDVEALLGLSRISDPQVSPDGKRLAFTVQTIDLAANKKPAHIWVMELGGGGTPVRITQAGDRNDRPRWSPDSAHIVFISDRGGSSQIWMMRPDGGEARQITSLATEADGVLYSPDGKNLVFTSEVYPACGADDACNKARLDAESKSKVKARIYTSLLYRHWTHWRGERRTHLLTVPVEGGEVKDLTPGERDAPPFSLGGPDDYAISPDGAEVCYVANPDEVPAASTNSDLFVVPIAGGEAKKITVNPGADNSPAYSPDGKYLAWRAQARAGYEADRWRLVVLERATGKLHSITEGVDRWVAGFAWSPDSTRLFFTVEDRGRQGVQMAPVGGGGARTIVSGDSTADDVRVTPDGKTLVYLEQSGSRPNEIFAASSAGVSSQLTRLNDALLAAYRLPPLEEFWVEGAEKARVHSYLVKPPGFDASKKYPVLFLIHGGPQGAWGESWTFRWNAHVFAAAGFVVVEPNPRGSTGYGQKFVDEINRDWGGRPYDDILAVVAHVEKLPYVDPEKFAAAGGSYGGYMVNWILGRSQRFRALVSHAGVYNLTSMFGATEELWFPLWDYGAAPWNDPDLYARMSPSSYAKDFRTPTLVIHGEQDFRVPYTQGLELFTALQMQKVPSKLLLYPDEGHWIGKPQNTVLWYRTFLDWVKEWIEKPLPAPPAAEPAPAPPAKP